MQKANVPQLRVHDLRHSCATLLFTMGVQPATVQRILRHSSITVTTGTYVEVIEAVQRDALDSMGSLFDVPTFDASASKSALPSIVVKTVVKPPRSWGQKLAYLPGGAKGTRTPDPHTASVVRYQLRHSPVKLCPSKLHHLR